VFIWRLVGAQRARLALAHCVLLALAGLVAQSSAAEVTPRALAPLPERDYSTRSICPHRTPGRANCLALELVPETPAAKARGHPLGITLRTRAATGRGAEACKPPTAAEGCYGLRPQDLHSAYELPASSPVEQTIALVDAYNDPTAESDLENYDEVFGLPQCTTANGCFKKINQKGESENAPFPKTLAELTAARKGTTAEKKKAREAEGWAQEISLDIQIAHAICENCQIVLAEANSSSTENLEAAEEQAVSAGATEVSNSWWTEKEPAVDSLAFDHPGIAITAAAGDGGYLNWDAPTAGEKGAVDYPASSPHVIAVGGTRLELNALSNTWKAEPVWNGKGATGGGCSIRFSAPPWQQELADWTAVGCVSKRAVADVSADADPYTGVAVYDTTPDEGGVVQFWVTMGGTSLSSPLIASVFALAGGAGGVEYPARTLYEHEVRAPASLHDVASGSNGECSQPFNSEGLSGCTALEEALSCGERAICLAGSGYSGPPGVGTPSGIAAFEPTKAQLIEFTSAAPASAVVGGPAYTVSATASSGLEVSFSSGSPGVCSIAGASVSFIGAGTCAIGANQEGRPREWEPAPEAQQSFTVGKGAQTISFTSTPPASAVAGGASYNVSAQGGASGNPVVFTVDASASAVCAISGFTVAFTAAGTCAIDANEAGNANYEAAPQTQQSFAVSGRLPNSRFSSSAKVSPKTGAITISESVGDSGTMSWRLTFSNGKFGAFASAAKCGSGQIRLSRKCLPARVDFAKGRRTFATAGTVTFTVKPSTSAAKALRNALRRGKGLPVTIALSFQSSLGGSPVEQTRSITDKLRR
jgi:Subtilase family